MNTKKKYLNIPMVENLYNRNYCKELALKIIDDEKQATLEIRSHALWYLKSMPNNKDVKLKINYNTSEGGELHTQRLCEVAMSPQHAKAFSNILNNVMSEYEKNFGKLKL